MADSEDDDGEGERRYRAPALEKGLDILELLAAESAPVTLTGIVNRLGRSHGELFRMVQVLEFRGFIEQDPSSDGYRLTDRLFSLGMQQPRTRTLIELALPVMRQLTVAVGQACHLALHTLGEMVVVARIEAPGNQGYSVRVGYHRPLIDSTSGLVLYAFQPEETRDEWRARLASTVTPKVWKAFDERAATARSQKHVRADSNVTKHLVDLSAPVMGNDEVVAALTCPYIETPLAIPIKDTVAAIRSTANDISSKIRSG